MINLPQRFLEDLKTIVTILVTELGENLLELGLFGSCARGEVKTGSDLDIMVITQDSITTHNQRGYLRELVDDYNVDLVFYNRKLFEEGDSLFLRNVKRDMITIWKDGVMDEQL